MKKCLSRYWIALCALSIISSAAFADQIWRETSAPSVIDEDLVIKGDVLLNIGGTRIEAIHRDVTVTLTTDATISGSWAGESQLYLMAAEGRTIRFVLDHDLTFVGSLSSEDLLIVQSGPGTVNMMIAPGKTFTITAQDGSGGVQMYVLMYGGESAPCDEYCLTEEYCQDEYTCRNDEYCLLGSGLNETSPSRPTLLFSHLPTVARSADVNTEIVIGRNSLLSFLSSRTLDIAEDIGLISFDPSSESLGRMVLNIKNKGAFIVSGHFTCQRNGGWITSQTIDLSMPAGKEAVWSIFNSHGSHRPGGLLVANENERLFDLLADPFLNLDARRQAYRSGEKWSDSFSGKRLGVIVGSNGTLLVNEYSYLDYVALALNQVPMIDSIQGFDGINSARLLKTRNPSALFIDGSNDPLATPAQFILIPHSAIFFRSGVANDGTVRYLGDIDPFTIDATAHTCGVGNFVFDVEGELNVFGYSINGVPSSKIELLSLEVLPTGGSLFVNSSETNFPLRTFNTEDGELLAYNTGAFLINNTMNLYNTALSHTDVNHRVVQDDDVHSEPTYVGGETFKLIGSRIRPNISFFNSQFLIHSDVALTGMDLMVPNLVDDAQLLEKNNSDFVFFSSGACVDNGTGRNMILGTRIGSTSADGCSRVNNDANIVIAELFDAIGANYPLTDTDNQKLSLLVDFNDAAITNVEPDMETFSINTIFLGNTSDIVIGVNANATGFNIDTNPWFDIAGNYFSFTTRGGRSGCSNLSGQTGQGGIFVNLNGEISIDPTFVASFCTMVVKSHNGIVDLPANQVFFCDGLGVTDRSVDLTMPTDLVIVPAGESLPDYVFNWIVAKKDCMNYSPYQVNGCFAQQATEANVSSLPIIQGTVNNLIIEGSRLGDPATVIIDGGVVRNIEFAANSCCNLPCTALSGQAPVAIVILRNNGTLELDGTPIGSNGVTIIADGSGLVTINASTQIGSGASFVKGPNFVEGDVLSINAGTPQEVVLASFGTLDLTSFNSATDLVEFIGNASLVVEPGAKILTGLGTLSFGNNAQLNFEQALAAQAFFDAIPHGAHNPALNPLATVDAAQPHNQYANLTNFGAGLDNTDTFRVRLIGQGTIELRDNARGFVPYNTFIGVETLNEGACVLATTDLELRLLDNAQFVIGELNDPQGGVFQVGNVQDFNAPKSRQHAVHHSVSFTLTINGLNADLFIGSQGFMGLGVGIERFYGTDASCKLPANQCIVPNENIVATLFDVDSITFNFLSGRFESDRIFRGDDNRASLFAISGDPAVTYNMFLTNETDDPFNFAGGGNMALINPGKGGIHPVVLDQDGQVEVSPGVFSPRLWVSILASTLLQDNQNEQTDLTGLEFFELLKTHDAVVETSRPNTFGRANAATLGEVSRPAVNTILVDTVSQGAIVRGEAFDIIGDGTETEKRQVADDVGAVLVNIDQATNEILTISLIEK